MRVAPSTRRIRLDAIFQRQPPILSARDNRAVIERTYAMETVAQAAVAEFEEEAAHKAD